MVVQTAFLIEEQSQQEQQEQQEQMEAENMSSSQSADTETHSRSTEEAASTSSGRDYISNDGQSGFNSQGSCGTAYKSESDASVCERNRKINDLYSLGDINHFLDATFKKGLTGGL